MMKRLLGFILSLLVASTALAGDLYDHGSFPATNSSATSASMRAELDLIAAGFAKFPSFSGNNSKPLILNSGATGYTFTTGTLTLAGNFAISGAYATTLTVTGSTNVTMPTTGTLATLAGAESLSTKTLVAPVLSGSVTGTYTLAGTPTITAPTITSPTITGTTSIGNGATLTTPVLSGSVTGTYTLAGTPTITAPSISSPVLSGSTTGTYTLAGTPTITAPTISSPVLSGSATGTYTLAGTPTITAPAISSPVLSGSATGTYTLAGTPTITSPTISNPVLSGTVTGTYTLGGTPTIPGTLTAGTPLVLNPYAINSQTTQAHGLGAVPTFTRAELVCLTGELGYSANDRLEINIDQGDGSAWITTTIYKDATNLILTLTNNSSVSIARKDTKAKAEISPANWKLTVTPYRLN